MSNMRETSIAVVLIAAFWPVWGVEKSSTYVKTSNNEDLQSSGSGYSYQVRSGEPFSYSSYNTDSGSDLAEDRPATFGRYSHHPLPLHLLPLTPNYLRSYDSPDSYGRRGGYPRAEGLDHLLDEGRSSSSSGSDYDELSRSSKGEKGDSSYSNLDEYAKGSKGAHANENRKGYYATKGGNAQSAHKSADSYNHHKARGKAYKGGSFADEKSHDKGSKTTGYHKVFHKDELKKDHTFYDKADKRGYYDRYGDFEARREQKGGEFRKGGSRDKGFKEKEYGRKDSSDKGKYLDEDRRYDGEKGRERFFKVYEDFAKRQGRREENEDSVKQSR